MSCVVSAEYPIWSWFKGKPEATTSISRDAQGLMRLLKDCWSLVNRRGEVRYNATLGDLKVTVDWTHLQSNSAWVARPQFRVYGQFGVRDMGDELQMSTKQAEGWNSYCPMSGNIRKPMLPTAVVVRWTTNTCCWSSMTSTMPCVAKPIKAENHGLLSK